MGIDPSSLTEQQLKRMDPLDRRELGLETYSETHERMVKKLERDEQNTFAAWLALREDAGVLVYDWSRTDRKTTNRKGMPDFRIYAHGKALLGEMKVGTGKLSPDQSEMIENFERSGTDVQLWHSAAEGIEKTRNWLSEITYGKSCHR